jgi:hypothetical protein
MLNFFKSEEEAQGFIYTEDQLMARLKFFIGICLSLTLTGIVFVVLYSLIFVTQPLNAISPIDQKFFELIVPIATFLTGTLSGIMLSGQKKEDQEAFLAAQKQAQANYESVKAPAPMTGGMMSGGVMNAGMMRPPMSPMTVPQMSPVTNSVTPLPVAVQAPQVITGFGGKPAPMPAPQPEI